MLANVHRAAPPNRTVGNQARSILIVEDEIDLAETLSFQLQREGFACRRVEDGQSALSEIARHPPDLILLDRMLPRMSGDDVATRLKRDPATSFIPVIMLTAKGEDADELVGFALGADDYVRKPFSIKLLLARINAMLRREEGAIRDRELLTGGPITLDRGRHEVTVDGAPVPVTATEFRVLRELMNARGRVLEREQLIDSALGVGVAVTYRTIDVHITALRRKLGAAAAWIHTVRGVGYAFRPPEEDAAPADA
ncbi:MAG: response regulator transcription factor [Phycisphaerae bacterium]|nr:response regulator transcription factor [Phycisphaerae bacterium]NUQ45487.1 response regulator transcription factor [Phycisphaerae bacterium]